MNQNNNPNTASPFVFTCPDKASFPIDVQEFRHDRKLIDIQLKIDEEKFAAHRLVLASSCPVFKAMLLDNWDPEKKEDCVLKKEHVDPKIVNDLLDFVYTRKVTITMDNAKLLCIAANFLDIPTLKDAADEYLKNQLQLSPQNLFDWFNFASMHQLKFLHESCIKFIYKDHDDVLQDDMILVFPAKLVLELFNGLKGIPSDMISNEAMFTLMIKWLKHDSTNRSDFMLDLLKCIPLVELSENFLKNIVNKEEIVVNQSASRQLVVNALNELSSDSHLSKPPPAKKRKASPSFNLYFFGGNRPLPDTEQLNFVSHFDVSTKEWNQLTPMPFPREGFCITAIGQKVYVFGGKVDGDNSNIAEMFDTKNNRWTQLRPMPTARSQCSAVSLNGFIYVSGGVNESLEENQDALDSVDCYCLTTNEWISIAPMLRTRKEHKLVLFNGCIYAIGGMYHSSPRLPREQWHIIEKYDPKNNSWEEVLETQSFSFSRDVIVYQNEFYGFDESEFSCYDTHTYDVLDVPDIPEPDTEDLFDSSVVLIDDKIWAIEHVDYSYDEDRLDRNNKFYEFDPATDEWKPLDVVIDVPRWCFEVVAIER